MAVELIRHCFACKIDLKNSDQECPVCFAAPGHRSEGEPDQPAPVVKVKKVEHKPVKVEKKAVKGRPKKVRS